MPSNHPPLHLSLPVVSDSDDRPDLLGRVGGDGPPFLQFPVARAVDIKRIEMAPDNRPTCLHFLPREDYSRVTPKWRAIDWRFV